MFTSSSAWLGTSVFTPGYRTIGRRFTYWSSSNRIRSSRSRSRMPGRIRGSPTAPSRIASSSRRCSSSSSGSVSPVRRYRSAPRSSSSRSARTPSASRTFSASRDDLGAGPVAADHRRCRCVTRPPPRPRGPPRRRRDHERPVDGGEVGARARLDDVGGHAAAGHPPPVDVELDHDVTQARRSRR